MRYEEKATVVLIMDSESDMAKFFASHPRGMWLTYLVSIIIWLAIFFEFWFLLDCFNLGVNVREALIILTAAKLAFLTPLPGGIGILEASQVWAMQAVNLPFEYGLGISLVIRVRDVGLGMVGLAYGFWALKFQGS